MQVLGPDKIADLNLISATDLELPTSTVTVGGLQFKNTSALALDLTTNGVGGLDTGSLVANTQYFVYVVNNSNAAGIIASILDTDDGPNGFSSWKQVGSFETNDTAEIRFIYETAKSEGTPRDSVAGVQTRQQTVSYPGVQINNLFINSAMDFWQRGTSAVEAAPFFDYRGPDRFWMENRGGSAASTWDRVTNVPNNQFKYSLEFAADTGASGDNIWVFQKIEADNIRRYIGKTMTFSLWLNATLDSDDSNEIRIYTPSSSTENDWLGGAGDMASQDLEFSQVMEIPMPGGWFRRSYTFIVPSSASKGLAVGFHIDDVDDGESVVTTGWMLHEGSQVVDFQKAGRNMQEELAMCQRYFFRHQKLGAGGLQPSVGLLAAASTTRALGTFGLPVEPRASVSFSYSNLSDFDVDAGSITPTQLSIRAQSNTVLETDVLVASGLTTSLAYKLNHSNANAYLDFDAEL